MLLKVYNQSNDEIATVQVSQGDSSQQHAVVRAMKDTYGTIDLVWSHGQTSLFADGSNYFLVTITGSGNDGQSSQ